MLFLLFLLYGVSKQWREHNILEEGARGLIVVWFFKVLTMCSSELLLVVIKQKGIKCTKTVCIHLVLNYVLNLKLCWIILRHRLDFIDNIWLF